MVLSREHSLTDCLLLLDAEEACADGGMLAHPLDLSYLGVQTIWTEDLGKNQQLGTARIWTMGVDTQQENDRLLGS